MANWTIDESHSEVGFKVKHLMITNVSGYFSRFTGRVQTVTDDFENASITFEISADSINTQNYDRDQHLKADDFLDATQYPRIHFVSKKVKKVTGEKYKLLGDLTIKGHTHPIELDVVHNGSAKDAYGNDKVGFALKGSLHRTDYGLRWNAITEGGGIVLSDEVKLNMEIQLLKS